MMSPVKKALSCHQKGWFNALQRILGEEIIP